MSALIATVANGKTHLQDLASSLGKVLPTASALGVKLPDVAGALATLTNSGMSARLATMHLNNTLLAMAAPSSTAQKSMQAVGLSAQQVKDTLSHQGLGAALQMVEQHVGATFPKSSVAYVTAMKNILGGTTGYTTALALGGKSAEAYSHNVTNIGKAFDSSKGQVQGWGDTSKDLNTKVDMLKGTFQAWMIELGQKLIPIVTDVVSWVQKFTLYLSQHKAVAMMVMGALVAVVAALAGIPGAIALVIAALVYLWDHFKSFRTTVETVIHAVVSTFQGLVAQWRDKSSQLHTTLTNLMNVVTHVWKTVINVTRGMVDAFVSIFSEIFKFLRQAWDIIAGLISTALSLLTGHWSQAWHNIVGVVERVFTGLIPSAGRLAGRVVSTVLHALGGLVAKVFDIGENIVKGLAHGIMSAIGSVGSAIGNVAHSALHGLKSMLGIFSPSREFAKLGQFIGDGLALGISNSTQGSVNAMQAHAAAVLGAAGGLTAGSLAVSAGGGNSGTSGAVILHSNVNVSGDVLFRIVQKYALRNQHRNINNGLAWAGGAL
jgi:phage-related protein